MINLDNRDLLTRRVDPVKVAAELKKSIEVALTTIAGKEAVTPENIMGVIRHGIAKRCNANEAVWAWADELRTNALNAAADKVHFQESKK